MKTGKKSHEGIIQLSITLLKKIQSNTTGTLRLTKKALSKLQFDVS